MSTIESIYVLDSGTNNIRGVSVLLSECVNAIEIGINIFEFWYLATGEAQNNNSFLLLSLIENLEYSFITDQRIVNILLNL